jgi:hypothetical protein
MTTELIQLTNQPKTAEVATDISDVPTAESGTSETREVEPRPTPQNTGRAGRWTRRILWAKEITQFPSCSHPPPVCFTVGQSCD